MTCEKCVNIEIPSCLSELVITGLENETEYVVSVKDKFEVSYNVIGTTNEDGELIIHLEDVPADGDDPAIDADLPLALLNPYAGQFILSILKDDDVQVPFTKDNESYGCARLTVLETNPSPDYYELNINL